jgi:hypothetical protein
VDRNDFVLKWDLSHNFACIGVWFMSSLMKYLINLSYK